MPQIPSDFSYLINFVNAWVVPLTMGWFVFCWFGVHAGNRKASRVTDRAFFAGIFLALLFLFLLIHLDTSGGAPAEPGGWAAFISIAVGVLYGAWMGLLSLPASKKWVLETEECVSARKALKSADDLLERAGMALGDAEKALTNVNDRERTTSLSAAQTALDKAKEGLQNALSSLNGAAAKAKSKKDIADEFKKATDGYVEAAKELAPVVQTWSDASTALTTATGALKSMRGAVQAAGKKFEAKALKGLLIWGASVFVAVGVGMASLVVYHTNSPYPWWCRLLQYGFIALVVGYRFVLLIGD